MQTCVHTGRPGTSSRDEAILAFRHPGVIGTKQTQLQVMQKGRIDQSSLSPNQLPEPCVEVLAHAYSKGHPYTTEEKRARLLNVVKVNYALQCWLLAEIFFTCGGASAQRWAVVWVRGRSRSRQTASGLQSGTGSPTAREFSKSFFRNEVAVCNGTTGIDTAEAAALG